MFQRGAVICSRSFINDTETFYLVKRSEVEPYWRKQTIKEVANKYDVLVLFVFSSDFVDCTLVKIGLTKN